jgi:signal transduction histidine kinase
MKKPLCQPAADRADRLDWSQVWYPGPTRIFTPEELAQAGHERPSQTLVMAAMVNYALLGFMLMQFAPPAATASLSMVLSLCGLIGWQGALRLWRHPTRRGLALWTFAGVAATMFVTVLTIELKDLPRGSALRDWTLGTGSVLALLLSVVWWFVAIYRAHRIEGRLREQAEQQRALDMARQLAAAQIQPHFLYNALAALQHWVQAKDDRAAPMLAALTGFLRATLPLFNQQRLALGDEAEAVRQYLAVMALRLGDRLRWSVDVPPEAASAAVPPGLLLTLVENAVEHGVQPSLSGAEVHVQATAAGGRVRLTVRDTGPGLDPAATDGVGLANSRSRLAQAFGDRATLRLDNAPDGGCLATLDMPLEESSAS